ncbi:hypothetical protein VTN00DRAFT_7488 [Thermoascus crustaceus]|uniref:uncharacterized protein n=1 Tax=Thermoascus crustaceus TaxID=5088 RepID=UPI0037423EAE
MSRSFHCSPLKSAIAHPITAHGPPPKAPVPAPEFGERVERRKKQAELIEKGKEAQTQPSKPATALKKRFWKDVNVRKQPEGYQVLLDTRPVRTPAKTILTIPPTKPQLAYAIALEWDLLTSAQQALKHHLIPLTSITARAEDIVREDAQGQITTRDEILRTVMRYLDTDTLLCWVPEKEAEPTEEGGQGRETLRELQMRVAQEIIGFLTTAVWPGIEIKPVLNSDSIMPVSQPQATKDVIRGWVSGLHAYDLAALERGVLAGKSLLVAVRLLVEWSENFRHLQRPGQKRFGIEEAAHASSLEVTWQTDMWGEVEDTHDVDKEDLRRQLGSVVLLVSGETK